MRAPGMDSSSSPIVMIGGSRSNNTTPHHHYYTPTEQPSSFISSHNYISPDHHGGGGGPNSANNSGLRRGSNNIHAQYGKGILHHPPSSRATPQSRTSRGQSPSVNSLGQEDNIIMDSSLSPHIIGHGHNHLHDDSHIHINCDSSHSISPPNSNSNTTISCGSGNSTSANIGVPTSRDHNLRNGRNINNNRHKSKDNSNCELDYENYRNTRSGSSERRNKKSEQKMKKCILEDDNEKDGGGGGMEEHFSSSYQSKFKQRPPFINPNQEFLPICDALFNMISLAAYFCDVVFDVLTVYSWYKVSAETEEEYELSLSHHQSSQSRHRLLGGSSSAEDDVPRSSMPRELMWQWSLLGLVFIALSSCLSQALSFKWYKESERRGQKAPDGSDLEGPPPPCSSSILVVMHVSLVGVLWRYFKLFIPVDLRFVKNEVRDLCLLRLTHAFVEAAPMLLLQLYLIWHEPSLESVSDLTKVSTALSLFSVCWALASFSKNIRRQNVHKLVLTWLGVIFQFFWRLGTVTSRFLALSLYAIVYQYWVFVVLFLHWFCMLLWLISPKNIFHGEKMSPLRKVSYSAIVAVVYTFCYINVQETNSRTKVIIYYVTMFLENSLLFGVWLIAVRYEDEIWFRSTVTWATFMCFGGGLAFMCLYYKYFHVRKLSYVYDAESSIYRNTSSIGGCSLVNDGSVVVVTGQGQVNESPFPGKNGNGVIMGYRNGNANGSSVIVSNGLGGGGGGMPGSKKKTRESNQNFGKNNGGGGGGRLNVFSRKQDGGGRGVGSKSDTNQGSSSTPARTAPLYNKINGHHIHHPNVPGVFNCRFHPAMKRKKKKPTTFVPPPAVASTNANNTNNNNATSSSAAATPVVEVVAPQPSSASPILSNEISQSPMQQPSINRHEQDNIIIPSSQHGQLIHDANQHSNSIRSMHLRSNSGVAADSGENHHHHHHSHSIDFDNSTNSNHGLGNSSMSAHYDLPEGSLCFDNPSGGRGGGDGSASSSYGHACMYPVISNFKSGSGRMINPFWRRPLSLTMGSENEGSVSSRVDIQQKLQEKKQQQLAELREIEEEIKQGKLKRPELHEIIPQPVNVPRQPIPVEKKQPWFASTSAGGSGGGQLDNGGVPSSLDLSQRPPILIPTGGEIPHEILLDPQYLMYATPGGLPPYVDNGSGFYYNPDWPTTANYYEPLYQNHINGDSGGGTSPPSAGGGDVNGGRFCDRRRRNKGYFDPSSRESIYKSYRIPSDIDSQMSLPRSYTLPREFKYKRKFRKPVKTENFLPSTNSSDGDVDSGGEDPELYSQVRPYPLPLPSMHHIHNSTTPPGAQPAPGTTPTTGSGCGGGAAAAGAAGVSPSPTAAQGAGVVASTPAARQSRKAPNGRPRHKLHETKL